jgi:hypothetical protein
MNKFIVVIIATSIAAVVAVLVAKLFGVEGGAAAIAAGMGSKKNASK